jgi:anti-sigma regulatory factor (Ser/Thr protein kinase)
MRFVAARKEYPDVSVFWKDNPTIFSTTAAGDAGPMATLCLDAKGIFESLAPAFQNALQDYLVSVPGVLSQKDGVAYELPGGGYTDKFFDLRGLLINLPFKDALYEQAADLVERIANLVSANTVAAYGEVGAKLLGALERRKIDLKQVELGGWRELGAIRPADFFESGDRTLILTDVIGLGHAAKQIASMVRTAEGTPVAIIALLDTRQSERAGESVDNIQVHVLAYSPTNHWLEQPDGKEIVRFDPQKNPCDRLGEANVPEVILSPHQFWSLIQRSRSLHIGHRAVGGKRLRLHISSTKLAKDPVVKQYLVKQLQLFARGEGPYHFVLVPSRQQSESATRFRTHLKEAFPKAEFVLHNPESIDILSAHPAPHILIFDYGTFTGNTISSLLASCPAGAKVSIFLLVDRMSVDTWRTLKSTARDSIGRMAALYRFVPSDVIVPTESQLFYRAEALGRLEPWAATHRMLEYIEDQREALTLPMETESEADEAEPSSFGSAPVETITVIDSHASECRANSTVAELIQMLSARREPRTATNPGALYDEHIRHGIARDLASRTSDPVTILDVVAKVGSPNVRAELLNSFFLERSWRWPVLKEAVASRLPTLLESAGKAGSVRETEAIFHVLAILDKPLFLKSLGRLLKYVGSNDRLLCALSFEVVRLLEEDGPQGKATSDAVRETIAALRQINPPPVAPETVRRFLENIGFIWDPNATPPTKRLGYDEFFDKVVMECFPAELLCRHLTDHLFQRFGKDSRVSVWRLNPDRNELQCIAASPPLGEGRTYTQTENRLTGIPAKSERRSVLIQDITDEAELNRLQIDPHLVKDFVAWTTEQGYELLSVILLPIEDRHGFFGVCRVMKMCRGAQRRLDAADLEWVRSRLERFRKVAPEYGVARRDLAFASRLGRKLAAVVWDDSHSVRERIDNICQTINESLAVQWSAIAWLDKDRDVLTRCGCAGRGWTEASKHREMPRQTQSFLSWRVLESGIASYSPDLHGGPNPTSPPMEFLHSCIALPLVHGETCCGVLTLWSDLREGLSRLWADKGCLDLVSIETAQVVAQIHSLARARDAQAAQDIARRMSYSLRSRTGVLESELYLLKHQLGSAHEGALDHLEECVRFFKRSSLLASNIISLDRTGVLANAHCDLKEAVIRVCGLLHDGRIRLSIDTDTVVVSGERDRVEDILLELLRNATYFAPIQAGQIDVTLTADDRYARVDVQDNGPGIHPDLKPRLFQMFACYPVDRTGLGLHYARSLAQAFGGDLNETSEVQMGAHFVLRLKRPIN